MAYSGSRCRHAQTPPPDRSAPLAALRKIGFEVVRIKGSHHYLRHPDGRRTVVPVHTGETIGPGLLTRILAEAEITVETLREII